MTYYTTNGKIESQDSLIKQIEEFELSRLIDPEAEKSLLVPPLIRCGPYKRVSTTDQAKKERVSLQEQEEEIRAMAKSNGWEIVEVYEDAGISGGNIAGRDGFERMIQDAHSGKLDLIVAWSTDRLARNVDEMTQLRAKLRKINVQITSVKEPVEVVDPRRLLLQENEHSKKMMAYLYDWVAEADKRKIGERFRLGKIGKAKKGIIPGKTPYGLKKMIRYINDDPKQKVEKDEVVPEKIAVVKEMFDLYDSKSWGMRRIAEHLNLKGIPSPRNTRWCYSTIKYTLSNPTYCGMVRYGWKLCANKESRTRLQNGHRGILVKGQHEASIPYSQFMRVQKKMERRSKMAGRAVHSRGLLTGILKCDRCGGGTYLCSFYSPYAYTKAKEDRKKHKLSGSYFCSNYAQYGRSGCTKRHIVAKGKIERLVLAEINKLASSIQAQEHFVKKMKESNKENTKTQIKNIKVILKTIDLKKARLKTAYTEGVISLTEFKNDLNLLKQQQDGVLQQITTSQEQLSKEEELENQTKEALIALADFDKIWENAEFASKKDLLQTILKKVVYKGNNKIEVIFANT
jgi:site-specific DNA recombinase